MIVEFLRGIAATAGIMGVIVVTVGAAMAFAGVFVLACVGLCEVAERAFSARRHKAKPDPLAAPHGDVPRLECGDVMVRQVGSTHWSALVITPDKLAPRFDRAAFSLADARARVRNVGLDGSPRRHCIALAPAVYATDRVWLNGELVEHEPCCGDPADCRANCGVA